MPERLQSVPERLVRVRPRVVLVVLGVILAAAVGLWMLWVARQVVTWIFISMFLALALNPAVEALQRRGVKRRGLAVTVVYLVGLIALTALGVAFLPTLVGQVSDFVADVPGYLRDLTAGRGPLGFLERDYQIVARAQEAIDQGGSARLAGGATAALSVTQSVATAIAAILTILFLTLFMLLEGRQWLGRLFGLLPVDSAPRWRHVGERIYRTIGGYVTGNLVISAIAGITSTVVLLIAGVPYAIALGALVALLDLIPLAGAVIAMIIVSLVAFTVSTTVGLAVLAYFLIYQQIENQVLQPIVYGRTVNLSPLAVLIAVLIGAQVAGILGALGAIPIAGAIQVIIIDWHEHRQRRRAQAESGAGDSELQPVAGALPASPVTT